MVGRTGLWKKNDRKLERLPPQGYTHNSNTTDVVN